MAKLKSNSDLNKIPWISLQKSLWRMLFMIITKTFMKNVVYDYYKNVYEEY